MRWNPMLSLARSHYFFWNLYQSLQIYLSDKKCANIFIIIFFYIPRFFLERSHWRLLARSTLEPSCSCSQHRCIREPFLDCTIAKWWRSSWVKGMKKVKIRAAKFSLTENSSFTFWDSGLSVDFLFASYYWMKLAQAIWKSAVLWSTESQVSGPHNNDCCQSIKIGACRWTLAMHHRWENEPGMSID